MTRQELVTSALNTKKGIGLEIGPLTSPILSKDEARIFYADHMSQADLRQKYRDDPVNTEDIVTVDFIVTDTLQNAVKGTKFDYVIACHVIEHIPDTVRWFQDIESILKPGGILALAIPDKRYTFDIVRNPSTPGDIVGAYLEKHTRPTSAALYDFATESRIVKSAEAWQKPFQQWEKKAHRHTTEDAYNMCLKNLKPGEYIDCHPLVFTPHSFVKILRELIELRLFDFEVVKFLETNDQNIEFYVSLRKLPKSENTSKRQLASLPKLSKQSTIATMYAEKVSLQSQKESAQSENGKLLENIASLQAEIQALKTSKSWKVTRPLRSALKQAAKLKRS